MDLLSGPEVPAADYVIKSIIISVWAPLLLGIKPLFPVKQREDKRAYTHKNIYNSIGKKYIFIISIEIIYKLKNKIKCSSQWE